MKTRHRRQAHDLVHGEDHVLFDHAVDHEAVLGRIDVPPALVMPFKVQAAGRDDAEQRLQRRKRHRALRGLRQARALTALQVGFELGGLAIAFGGHALAQAGGVFGQVQDVGVTAFTGHRVALGHGHGRSHAGSGCCKCAADEITAAFFALGKNFLDTGSAQKILRRFLQAP